MPTISKDHKGNIFHSLRAMCEHWGINHNTIQRRLDSGWSIEKALTTPLCSTGGRSVETKDHLGNVFPSFKAMCQHWGIGYHLVSYRLDHGLSLEQALTTPVKKNCRGKCVDHEGNEFKTQKEMCEHYGKMPCLLHWRMKKGMSLKDALTTPINKKGPQI